MEPNAAAPHKSSPYLGTKMMDSREVNILDLEQVKDKNELFKHLGVQFHDMNRRGTTIIFTSHFINKVEILRRREVFYNRVELLKSSSIK